MFFEAGLLMEELRSPGRAGRQPPPLIPINRLKGAVLRIPDAPGEVF